MRRDVIIFNMTLRRSEIGNKCKYCFNYTCFKQINEKNIKSNI